METGELRELLDGLCDRFNCEAFVAEDPVAIPHRYTRTVDREVAGFLAATIAWGSRPVIVRNGLRLMRRMDDAPADFVRGASERELAQLDGFVHRTFQTCDLKDFVSALRRMMAQWGSLGAFFEERYALTGDMRRVLADFRSEFFRAPHQVRCEKHISDIQRGAACKRLNMFLRWMVRRDGRGVDFGLWRRIPMSALYLPLDVHSGRVARGLGLLTRTAADWRAVEQVTARLREFDPEDPVRYDYALFGAGMYRCDLEAV